MAILLFFAALILVQTLWTSSEAEPPAPQESAQPIESKEAPAATAQETAEASKAE